ncbi:MAG TPA: polysaccharide biosynthesis tyrosine autokinase, partial [Candidatus Aerophobetes bacterium]|nr:polysaccharide biosynthesis tyrosine autokinase [Candidatus Aerophobetes bacterium]
AKKLLLITSSAPNEGKSVFSVGLAGVMAQAGEKVLLVDVDFRHPNLHEVFGVQRTNGLSNLLAEGGKNMHNYIRKTEIKNLDLLTCGSLPPNSAELLGAKRMEELIQDLSKKYDRIIFDAPPVLAVTDALVLSTKVDGVIIIVRFESTHRKALQRAKETLERVNAKILGAVLNRVTPRGGGYYYYYYYHYGEKS